MLKKIKKFIVHREENYPNIQIFGYHFLKFVQKSLVTIKLISQPKNNRDMFNWSLYHLHYRGELKKNIKKYVILYESMKNHPFLDDIKKLHSAKKISWNKIFFYYRRSEETNLPMGLICSSGPLNYPELKDYNACYINEK